MSKRVFLIVLDSVGCGEAPDAELFGDCGSDTLGSCAASGLLDVPNMAKLGLFNIEGTSFRNPDKVSPDKIAGCYARAQEQSMGKDTTVGHWEMAGMISHSPLPTYPDGFPQEIIEKLEAAWGRKIICNKPYSGTDVIRDYGQEHIDTGAIIVYTSADSVLQIAAHEDIIPLEKLYEMCRIARNDILTGEHAVGRVIARPFIGERGNYTRTPRRHDFSLLPPGDTMLDVLKAGGRDVIAVGKINDIFAGKGITEYVYTSGNAEGIERTLEYLDKDFDGLCFINLVDYDMLYGHRRDVEGYAAALTYFDEKLPAILGKLRRDDALLITADHGCDPSYTRTTDHTREYTPMILFGEKIKPENLGTRKTFADIAATALDFLGLDERLAGESML